MEETTKRKKYDKQFKLDAVRLASEGGRTVASVARDLGVDANSLHHWKRTLLTHGIDAFPGNGRLLPPNEELRRLQRENVLLREERDILKKAMGYFAKNGK
jgi:transposase